MNTCYPFRVMVVDEDPVMRHSLVNLLKQNQYEVFETSRYEIAIRGFITLKPGLIFLDQNLESMSGLEIAGFIRRLLSGSHPKIYLYTIQDEWALCGDENYQFIDGYIKKGDGLGLRSVIRQHRDFCTTSASRS